MTTTPAHWTGHKGMILGMRVITFNNTRLDGHNSDYTQKTFKDEKYEIVVLYGSQLIQLTCSTSHGQCGSGWTTASWGIIEWKKVESIGSLHYTPIEYSEINFTLSDIPSRIEHTLFVYSEIGYDPYYPSGHFTIEMEGWRPTGRKPEKPMLHMFCGHSGTGKSTIAAMTGKEVIESDSAESGPIFRQFLESEDLSDKIIVVGNNPSIEIDLDKLETILGEKYTVIRVWFSSNEG